MLIPLSWLKEFVDIKMPFPDLAAKMSAAGLTIEQWEEKDGDIIFDPEVTPNRPDWLSVYGIAREISAVTGSKLKIPEKDLRNTAYHPRQTLQIAIKPNYEIVPRISTVIIKNVKVKPSPDWLQKRIKQIGLRPINNLVDITNYVLWAHGSLLHSFDYDKIRGHQMSVELSKGGEDFRSLDGIDYKLPKDAIVIKDVGRIIDLLPLKGGENTATFGDTKNILLHSVVVDPILARRTSQALGLRSDSSAVAEKGLDPNGTPVALNHALNLILELAGGEIASQFIDHKNQEFKPWTVLMRHNQMEKVLGLPVESKKVAEIFARLQLKATQSGGNYQVEIPTFRPDLKIEEDLIEEIGRLIDYNNFPKTLPAAPMPTHAVAFAKNFDFQNKVKQILKGTGHSETHTFSLVSKSQLVKLGIDPEKSLRIANPLSSDNEYLRPNLLGNLIEALKLNQANFTNIRLFELGKEFQGQTLDKFSESYSLSAIHYGEKYFEAKGIIEWLLDSLGIEFKITASKDNEPSFLFHPSRNATVKTKTGENLGFLGELHPNLLASFGVKGRAAAWILKYDLLEKLSIPVKIYRQIPKYPAIFENITLNIPETQSFGNVVDAIKSSSSLVNSISLSDTHEQNITLKITYLDRSKNLTDKEVAEIRMKFQRKLKDLGVFEK